MTNFNVWVYESTMEWLLKTMAEVFKKVKIWKK